ncbi:hypothetical protein [Dulcicalothrix desertica]|nr:hypothetical protein [Dulcicalothrix desertica]TWH61893.1 hypothetical protein CAL7102_00573 [Dulcicalothrix desertica PCC 7102]
MLVFTSSLVDALWRDCNTAGTPVQPKQLIIAVLINNVEGGDHLELIQ